MKIDLHNHSKYSDGILTVKELINLAHDKKIDIMGLTDHDSVFGVDEAYSYGKEIGVKVLKGMELSTFHEGQTVHIVCYFKNNIIPKELYDFSQNIIDTRLQRAHRMIDNIKDYYKINIDEDFLFKDACIVTRGNMYQCIIHSNPAIDHSYAQQMISDNSPCYIPASKMTTEDGIKFLNSIGAFKILAHPTLIKRELLSEILDLGFDAIEARYPKNKDGEEEFFRAEAQKRGMLISAGSDYHGDDKHAMIGSSTLSYEEFVPIKNRLGPGDEFNED